MDLLYPLKITSENLRQQKKLKNKKLYFTQIKGKQNKKENSKCDSLFGKDDL